MSARIPTRNRTADQVEHDHHWQVFSRFQECLPAIKIPVLATSSDSFTLALSSTSSSDSSFDPAQVGLFSLGVGDGRSGLVTDPFHCRHAKIAERRAGS